MAPLSTNAVAHFLHPAHKLTMINDETSYVCDGCKVVGNGTRFSCASCQFDLHEYCAKCPTRLTSTTNHPHTMSLVVYKPKPDQTEACQICLQPILGLVYECKSCSFLVHPLCVLRNSKVNHGSAQPSSTSAAKPSSSSAAQHIGEHIVGGVAAKLLYDTITNDKQEVPPTADSNAFGSHEESGGFFDGMMSAIESIFSSSSA